MAASIKVSELQELSSLTSDDLFLVTDLGSGSSRKVSYATLISDLVSQIGTAQSTLQAAINAVQFDVDQNELAAASSVSDEAAAREQAVAALQSLIDGLQTESSSRLTRIETLETTVDNLDIDISPETLNSINELAAALGDDADFVTTINNAIAAVQSDVDQNEADTDAAIAALQATIDALDIDIAPETLNSIDELAAAMGDDPTLLTTLQNRVTVIENDNATQTELNDYIAHIEARNLEAGLATGVLYADTIYGG